MKKNNNSNIIPFPKAWQRDAYLKRRAGDIADILSEIAEEYDIFPDDGDDFYFEQKPVDPQKIADAAVIVRLLKFLTRGRDIQIITEVDPDSACVYIYVGGEDFSVYDIQMFDEALKDMYVDFWPTLEHEVALTIVV